MSRAGSEFHVSFESGRIIIIIIIINNKNECHSNIIVDRLQRLRPQQKAAGKWKWVTQQ